MHSPFVFDFILNVLNNHKNYEAPNDVEELRKELSHNETEIEIEDLGAGSRLKKTNKKKIKNLATVAVKPKKYGQLLYRLAKHYQPNNIIELGTSLGVTTTYFSFSNKNAQITTIEGSQSIAQIAKQNFEKLKCNNIQLLQGNFDDILPSLLNKTSSIDCIYIDGNHRLEPTLNYFHQSLQKKHNNTILIFDDIHWSKEMEEAWLTIKEHPEVKCTIDIFFLGFVFFKKEFKEKQHFSIRY